MGGQLDYGIHKNKVMKQISVVIISTLIIAGCDVPLKGNLEPEADYNFGQLNPSAPPETEQWGQLVGVWKCISKDLDLRDKDNPVWYENKAIWKWEYVLGGHAVLNQWWQEDTSPNPMTNEFFATGMFIFNPETNLWEAVVMNSRPHKLSPKFQAEYKDGKIEMDDGTGKWLVTFYNIEKSYFDWKYEVLTPDGTWKPISEITATRKI